MEVRKSKLKLALGAGCALAVLAAATSVSAEERTFSVASTKATDAIPEFARQAGIQIVAPAEKLRGLSTPAVEGRYDTREALAMLIQGTGLHIASDDGRTVMLAADPQSGSAAGDGAEGTVQALIVTAQKREENIQDVPIAMSAFSQEDLTKSQIAGGPDLMTQVPNFTFTKTNFSSYSIQIRGIGTQAISATVDPAVAVAFNNTPFIRNRFFEQEFYDLQRVEVLRGPQGTLYGRNATAGVVNIISAKPTFEYAEKLSADAGNYNSTRLEGMVNLPLVADKVALRIAGAWTKRNGYDTNEITGHPIDGRDLWSTRVSLRVEPTDNIHANLIWEHFEENDDRLRSGKQLCKRDTVTEIGGYPVLQTGGFEGHQGGAQTQLSQGCLPTSMYSLEAFQVPNGYMLPYYAPLGQIGLPIPENFDPYLSATQSRDLRTIESTIDPKYRAKSDLGELQLQIELGHGLTLSSETGYNRDFLFSSEDFNRFNTRPGAFDQTGYRPGALQNGVFCDPQLGCSDRLVVEDLSTAKSWQFSQELRLASDFSGRFNFSLGANFTRYNTMEKYYVFANSLTLWAADNWASDSLGPYIPGKSDNSECLSNRRLSDPSTLTAGVTGCIYMDPNPIGSVNDLGHNYFLSKNPYRLISYAIFGEAYYNITDALKLTAGLRWTVDKKQAPRIPSELLAGADGSSGGFGYPVLSVVNQEWREPTGRLTLDWKPHLDFTDQTLVYASYAHGYKAGGMNPPPAVLALYGYDNVPALTNSLVEPPSFRPEFVDAYEIGTKNTLLDGKATLNADAFYYDYQGYQLSEIVNRSAVTHNYDAKIWGLELEAEWRPLENFKLGLKEGYEDTRVAKGQSAIDLMDRTAGHSDWVVVRPLPTIPSNCIVPSWFITWGGHVNDPLPNTYAGGDGTCGLAYIEHKDPATGLPYVPYPTDFSGSSGNFVGPYVGTGYPGYDPSTAPNNGEGFAKKLGGHQLPNAPHFTTTATADYTLPLPNNWLLTLHTDVYHQSQAWTRIFNFDPYDRLRPYTNVNVAAIFSNDDAGWQVMAYVKNVFNKDNITGAFLNSDDTGLTTNVFLNEPRLYGLRVTKNWTGGSLSPSGHTGPYPFTVEIGGSVERTDAPNTPFAPAFINTFTSSQLPFPLGAQNESLDWGDSRSVKVTYRPAAGLWNISAAYRSGRTNGTVAKQPSDTFKACLLSSFCQRPNGSKYYASFTNYADTSVTDREEHTLADFMVGRDFGIGGGGFSTSVALGLAYAQFKSGSDVVVGGIPDYYANRENLAKYPIHEHQSRATMSARREFQGAGPKLAWDGSKVLWGNAATGTVSADWELAGGLLYGKQKADGVTNLSSSYKYFVPGQGKYKTHSALPGEFHRSKSVTVPDLGVSLGLSYEVERIKMSGGYRIERFYNAIDGGVENAKREDRTFDGPYFKIAVGFGG